MLQTILTSEEFNKPLASFERALPSLVDKLASRTNPIWTMGQLCQAFIAMDDGDSIPMLVRLFKYGVTENGAPLGEMIGGEVKKYSTLAKILHHISNEGQQVDIDALFFSLRRNLVEMSAQSQKPPPETLWMQERMAAVVANAAPVDAPANGAKKSGSVLEMSDDKVMIWRRSAAELLSSIYPDDMQAPGKWANSGAYMRAGILDRVDWMAATKQIMEKLTHIKAASPNVPVNDIVRMLVGICWHEAPTRRHEIAKIVNQCPVRHYSERISP